MLKARAAVITGSTSGIGLGIARSLVAEGVDVMLNGFGTPEAIADLCAGLTALCGGRVAYHAADLAVPAEVADLVEATVQNFGRVDILVNNAGIQHVAPVEQFPPERWQAVMAVNLSAVFYAIHHALPHMKSRGWGRIINIASAHGLVASANKAAYVAAKHGVVGLTKVVGLETAESGITCNAICPGWVLTPLVQAQIDALAAREGLSVDEARHMLLGEKQPSKAFVTPEQIGALAVFLCSEAASQMTGSALSMDGGWTAQ